MAKQGESIDERLDFVTANLPSIFNLNEYHQQRMDPDFSLISADHSVACHLQILNARSKFFATLPDETSYKLHTKASCDILDSLVSFFYTGEISLNAANCLTVFEIAVELQLTELLEACQRFFREKLKPTTDNWWKIYRVMSKYVHREDVKECVRPLQRAVERTLLDDFYCVYQTDEFLELSFDTLKALLRDDDLKVADEEEVLRALVRWLQHRDSRSVFAAELLYYVRLPFLQLTADRFLELKREAVFQNKDCQLLLENAKWDYVTPGDRWFMQSKATIPRPSIGMTSSLAVISVDQSRIYTWIILNHKQLKSLSSEGPSVVSCIPKAVSSDAMVFEYCDDLYLLDVATDQLYVTGVEDFGQWHPAEIPLHLKRKRCSWVTVGNQTWFIGGVDEEDKCTPVVEWFDWETRKLEQGPSLPCAVQQSCAFHTPGKVYVIDGKDVSGTTTRHVQVFDMKQKTWILLADSLPASVCEMNAIAYDGDVYLPIGRRIGLFDLSWDKVVSYVGAEDSEDDASEGPGHVAVVDNDVVMFRGNRARTVTRLSEDSMTEEESSDEDTFSTVDDLWGTWTGKRFFFSINLPQFALNLPSSRQGKAAKSKLHGQGKGCITVLRFTVPRMSECRDHFEKFTCRSETFILRVAISTFPAPKDASRDDAAQVALFLCNDSYSEQRGPLHAEVEVRLVDQRDRKNDFRLYFSEEIHSNEFWGLPCFITTDKLFSPRNGYYNQSADSVQFEVTVVVSPDLA